MLSKLQSKHLHGLLEHSLPPDPPLEDQRKGCSELRPRSHAWTKPQPVFLCGPAPAMIPSSLPLSAELCKMNTGNSSETHSCLLRAAQSTESPLSLRIGGEPRPAGRRNAPGGKGRLGVQRLEAGGQGLPPLSTPLGPWRLIVGFLGRGLDWGLESSLSSPPRLTYNQFAPLNFSFKQTTGATCPHPPTDPGPRAAEVRGRGSGLPPPRALSSPPSPEQRFLHKVLCKGVCHLVRSMPSPSPPPSGTWSVEGCRDLRAPWGPLGCGPSW